jgi:ferrous-iron efflux pump FieF
LRESSAVAGLVPELRGLQNKIDRHIRCIPALPWRCAYQHQCNRLNAPCHGSGLDVFDPLFAVMVSAFLMWNAKGIANESLEMLMDKELPDHERNNLRILALGHVGVRNVHDLRTRLSGQNGFIQLHLEFDGAMSLKQSHDIGDEVERSIIEAYPNFEVTIHQDPV